MPKAIDVRKLTIVLPGEEEEGSASIPEGFVRVAETGCIMTENEVAMHAFALADKIGARKKYVTPIDASAAASQKAAADANAAAQRAMDLVEKLQAKLDAAEKREAERASQSKAQV